MTSATHIERCQVRCINKPAGSFIEKDETEPSSLDAHTLKLMLKGWGIKQKIAELKAEFADIEGHFRSESLPGTYTMPGVCAIERQVSNAPRITDVDALRALLDDAGFVASVGKIPEASMMNAMQVLQAVASDGDHPYSRCVRKLLGVGPRINLTWSKA